MEYSMYGERRKLRLENGGKRSLGTTRRRWEVNIKMDLCLAQDRDQWRVLVNMDGMNLRVL
jgi:hypothetical protein